MTDFEIDRTKVDLHLAFFKFTCDNSFYFAFYYALKALYRPNESYEKMKKEKARLEFVFEECNLNPDFCRFPVSKVLKTAADPAVTPPSVEELLFTMKNAGGWCPDGVQKEMSAGRVTKCTQLDSGTYNRTV